MFPIGHFFPSIISALGTLSVGCVLGNGVDVLGAFEAGVGCLSISPLGVELVRGVMPSQSNLSKVSDSSAVQVPIVTGCDCTSSSTGSGNLKNF